MGATPTCGSLINQPPLEHCATVLEVEAGVAVETPEIARLTTGRALPPRPPQVTVTFIPSTPPRICTQQRAELITSISNLGTRVRIMGVEVARLQGKM